MTSSLMVPQFFILLFAGMWQSAPPAQSITSGPGEIRALALLEPCPEFGAETPTSQKTSQATAELSRKDLSQDSLLRLAAGLGNSCDRSAIDPLIDLLGHSSEDVRVAVIEALGRIGSPDGVGPLSLIVNTESNRVKLAIARTLLSVRRGNARAMALNYVASPAIELRDEEDMRIRGSVILTFNELTNNSFNQKAIIFLRNYLSLPDPKMVKIAEEVMRKLPETRNGKRELIGILKHRNDPQIRVWVCSWLGRLQIVEGRDALTEAAEKDVSPLVRTAAVEALKSIDRPSAAATRP
ncbi:MAG: HEAT repeat domain-containing protein [Acidobacteria bacterium]|nr:HEAT repeat domain-containing protein [Acidobacteriota bacterium]